MILKLKEISKKVRKVLNIYIYIFAVKAMFNSSNP